MKISQLPGTRAQVGEGPLWNDKAGELLYVDILGQEVCSYHPASGRLLRWGAPTTVAAVATTHTSNLMVALADGFFALDRVTGHFSLIAEVESPLNVHLSDGKVDRQGRFVAVSSDFGFTDPIGSLIQLGLDGEVRTLDSGFVVGNGPAWSCDEQTKMYACQSLDKEIYAYDYDSATGMASNRRLFASTQKFDGIPDGVTVDSENHLWVVIHGAGLILRLDPDGKIERSLELPTLNITSLTFGGQDLDELYVTSLDPSKLPRTSGTDEAVGGPVDAGTGFVFHLTDLGFQGLVEPDCLVKLS
jgi:sugar lactone lactonase YvrE